ncbi:MAG: DUF4249 domain-containing protein [Reichenbachiella sp.]
MRNSMNHIVLFQFGLLSFSCVEPYEYLSTSYDELIVIEGLLTDENKNHEIKISYTYPVDFSSSFVEIDNAEVFIEEKERSIYHFHYTDSGKYVSDNSFQGLYGKEYRLVVNTEDGQRYQSTYELLVPSPPIDSIYDFYAELPNSETDEIEPGIQFFISTNDQSGIAKYFRYELQETYKIVVPYPSYFEVQDGSVVRRIDQVGSCYKSVKPSNLIIGTSSSNSENRLEEFPLNFIFQSSQKIRTRYSVLVKQYAISETAYHYYRRLKENNESTGSLSDKQTGTIVGNISSTQGANEPVLGYFEVSGTSEKREFFSFSDFDPRFEPASFQALCDYRRARRFSFQEGIEFIQSNQGYQIHTIEYASGPGTSDALIILTKSCTSCAEYADTTPPNYWIP